MSSYEGANDKPQRPGANWDAILACPMVNEREPRRRTLIQVLLQGDHIPGQKALVRNVSESGMCVTALTFAPDFGDEIQLILPIGITLEGEVRWVEKTTFGVRLTGRLDLRQLELATQRRNRPLAEAIDWRVDSQLRSPAPPPGLRRI